MPLIRKFRLAAGDTPGKYAQQALAGRREFRDALEALAAGLDRPTSPLRAVLGSSTELSTSVMATIGPVISSIAFIVASRAGRQGWVAQTTHLTTGSAGWT